MKYNELYKKLRKAGCFLLHHGARRDLWVNPSNGKQTRVGRHGTEEVPKGTLKSIYRGCVKMLFQEKDNSNLFDFGCICATNRMFATTKIGEIFTPCNEPSF